MVCEEAQFLSSLLVDQQLSEEDAARLQQHFSHCSTCKSNFEEEVSLKSCLKKKAKAHQVPESLLSSVQNMLAHPELMTTQAMTQTDTFSLDKLQTSTQSRKRTLVAIAILTMIGLFLFYWIMNQY